MEQNKYIAIRLAVFVLTQYYKYETLISYFEFIIENYFGYEILFYFVVIKYFILVIAKITLEIIEQKTTINRNPQSTESEPNDSFGNKV